MSAYVGLSALVLSLVPALALASSSSAAPSARADSVWTPVAASRLTGSDDGRQRRVDPSAFRAYTLDATVLAAQLAQAPDEAARGASPAVVSVPAPTGELVDFEVVESPVMEAGLAAANPEITTYAGRSLGSESASIRLDLTPMGFHASVRGAGASWYVDPAYNGDTSTYLSYLGADLPTEEKSLVEPEMGELGIDAAAAPRVGESPGGAVVQRSYRLALVTDPSYARYFGTQNVLAEKVTLMNRVNQIYNDDLAIRLLLIDQTDKLNLDTPEKAFGASGPCGSAGCFTGAPQLANGCTGALLNRNRIALGQLVGAGSYDIGHIALGINGGGIAGLGVVGRDGKARGCTGLPQPEGDYMAVDYVAHEMGHQFAGNHTFNGTQLNCGGNKAAPSVEPGSGSSVMGYAGICRQDDLQPHSDPYFSQRSQSEISTYVTSAQPAIDEVQTVSLIDFDGVESFRLSYEGRTTSPVVRGTTYSAAGIKAALEPILPPGSLVTVAPFGGGPGEPTDTGFQVTFTGAGSPLTGVDAAPLTLTPVDGDVTGFVGETAQGGPVENGGSVTATPGNRGPITAAPASKSIPLRTPFALTGTASDADGDGMVYQWEQNDQGAGTGTSLVDQVKSNGPLFRIFGTYADVTPAATLEIGSPGLNIAGGDPTRTFPDLDQILANNTNAETGRCPDPPAAPTTGGSNVPVPTRDCFSEWLPTADYVGTAAAGNIEPSLDFRFTARDLAPDAGGYSFADTKLLIDKTAGPFLVTSKNVAAAAVAGRSEVVSWDVKGTDKPTLATNVKISLSVDGGRTYPTVLVESTPNDGSEPVSWPSIATTRARIKIEAVDNYFFDVNNADFQIVVPQGTPTPVPTPGPPDTSVTSGPAEGALVLDPQVGFGYASTEPPGTFQCTFDGAALPCGTSATLALSPVATTHVFTVAAVDADGNVDASPARRTFTVPIDDAALRNKKKAWRDRKAAAAYLDSYRVTRTRGATLQKRVTGATSLSLVVGTGKRYGAVKVFLGRKLLDRVSLKGPRRFQTVVPVATFASPVTGRLRIVTTGAKQVRIDALGVVTTR